MANNAEYTPSEFTKDFFRQNPNMLDEFLKQPKFVTDIEGLDYIKYLCKLSDQQNSSKVRVPKSGDKVYIGGWAKCIAHWHDVAIQKHLSDEAHVDYVNERIYKHHEGAKKYKKYLDAKTGIILPSHVH